MIKVFVCLIAVSSAQRILDSGPDEEFEYHQGGDDWIHFYKCKRGRQQSPIDLPFFEEDIMSPIPRDFAARRFLSPDDPPVLEHHIFEPVPDLTFEARYGEIADVEVQNLTDTVWIDVRHLDGSLLVREGNHQKKEFRPVQFHFHAPSEHTIDGRHYDLEMHFYHVTSDGLHKSVVVVFFDSKMGGDEDSPFIESLFTTPNHEDLQDAEHWVPVGVHLEALLLGLDRTKLFHYEGSLTVPPCTENVEWNIIDDP